jgi:hypothetical protein
MRESSESRVGGDMSLFRAAARKSMDSRLRGNYGCVGVNVKHLFPDES